MDFIKIFNISSEVIYLNSIDVTLIAFIIIPVVIYLIFFILEGVGLYTMASQQGVGHKWRAFVPFVNSYLMGELTGDCPFCGKKIKNIKVWILCVELAAFITGILYLICDYLLSSELFEVFRREIIDIVMGVEVVTYEYDVSRMSGWHLIIYNMYQIDYYIFLVCDLLYVVFYIILLTNFFRKYFAKNYFMLVLLCVIFPVQGACVFAVRNNKPVDYNAYINKRRARYFNQNTYHNPYNYYSGRNNGGGSNGNGGYNYDPFTGRPINHNTSDEEPFSEFGGSNGNYSDNNGKGNKFNDDDPFGL